MSNSRITQLIGVLHLISVGFISENNIGFAIVLLIAGCFWVITSILEERGEKKEAEKEEIFRTDLLEKRRLRFECIENQLDKITKLIELENGKM